MSETVVPEATTPAPAPDGWALMAIPDELRLGPIGIAERCSWELKGRADNLWEVCLRENVWETPRVSFQPELLVRAAEANRSPAYERLGRWSPQDQYLRQEIREAGMDQVKVLLQEPRREARWEAFTLLVLLAPDAELPAALQAFYETIAPQLVKSSVWTVAVDPVVHARKTMVRALLAAAAVLNRDSIELQNRRSASLAMSKDGSFPSRPRHFQFRADRAPSCYARA